MAFAMKHWLACVAAGMALMAAWRLPLETPETGIARIESRVEIRHRTLSSEVLHVHAELQRLRWIDSLSALVVQSAEGGLAVTAPAFAVRMRELWEPFRNAVRGEEASLTPRDPGMVVGYAVQPFAHGLDPGAPYDARGGDRTYVGSRDGVAYCLQVLTIDPSAIRAMMRYRVPGPARGYLGACRPYARYGFPGARIQRWLDAGALSFATGSARSSARFRASSWRDRQLRYRRHLFGVDLLGGGARPYTIDHCLTGETHPCAALFLSPNAGTGRPWAEPDVARRAAANPLEARSWPDAFWGRPYLLADLESEFGPEAFRRFWTSEAGVREAFETAFGVDPGAWLVTWFDDVAGIEPSGPGLPRSAAFGSLLAIGLFAGLATRRHTRRALGRAHGGGPGRLCGTGSAA